MAKVRARINESRMITLICFNWSELFYYNVLIFELIKSTKLNLLIEYNSYKIIKSNIRPIIHKSIHAVVLFQDV